MEKNVGNDTFNSIYSIVKMVPAGMVTTYGQIARLIGRPNYSKIVGYALHANPDQSTIPCHRIVNRFGELSKAFAFGGINEQKVLLENEGITFLENGNVDLKKFMWYGQ